MPQKRDLTNLVFGRLTVKYENKERRNGKITWHCQCECGNEVNIIGTQLTKQKSPTRSCGCLQRENTRKANQMKGLENQKFGRLTVISRNEIGNKWICKCDCGNIIEVNTNHLNQKHTQSCGCLQRDKAKERLVDLTGKRYGLLKVVERDEPLIDGVTRWICECDCGNTISVVGSRLKNGDTQSCGCLRISHGELKIRQLLNEANIPYQVEYMFKTCKNPKTNKPLRFDFYVNNSYLIEYDGKQHFDERSGWELLKDTQYRDNIKNEWCKENNIPLIRIPYTMLDSLTINDLIIPVATN